jgi:hypothetical protein
MTEGRREEGGRGGESYAPSCARACASGACPGWATRPGPAAASLWRPAWRRCRRPACACAGAWGGLPGPGEG